LGVLGPSNPGGLEACAAAVPGASARYVLREDDVSPLFRYLLDSPGPVLGDLALFGAGLLGVLLVYLGVAMAAALFHRDRSRRLMALAIFRDLLGVFSRRQR
jgi:hypothetical protein